MGEEVETLVDAAPAEAKLAWVLTNISDPSCGKRGAVEDGADMAIV
jgi:hypothetical protein